MNPQAIERGAASGGLPDRFRSSWAQAQGSTFVAWWRQALGRLLDDPATEAALPRAATRRVLGREDEALEQEVLPRLDADRRERLLAELASAEPADAALAGCVLDLLASHRPFLVAEEILKRRSTRVERNLLEEVLGGLAPRTFFAAHLAPAALERLQRARPEAFAPTDPVRGTAELRELAAGFDEQALDEPEGGAVAAWRSLLREPAAFDYGCGLGALASVLSEQFEASGGDIYEHLPTGELSRALAWLRMTRCLDRAPAHDDERVVRLDLRPGPDSPPAEGRFSAVTCNGVLEHVLDPGAFEAVGRKLVRLLRPGGVLVLNASPTLLGFDSHHAIHRAWGALLHRLPALQSLPRLRDGWRAGYTHRVSRRRLLAALGEDARPPRERWPQEATVRARFGRATPLALPLLRFVGRTELAPAHAWVVHRRL